MNAAPSVTVLMPVYNAARHLQEAVESVLNQSHKDFELLVVDDGSTDEGLALLARYDDPRIRIERLPRNGGIVAALNHGLRHARGSYIARMDADDIALPIRLERQLQYLEQYPEMGVCGSTIEPFGGHLVRNWVQHFSPSAVAVALLFENPLCHPTVMFRASGKLHAGALQLPPSATATASWLPYVAVAEITAAERRAQSLGAAILRGATELPGLGAFCVLQDPTGAELALWEDRTPS